MKRYIDFSIPLAGVLMLAMLSPATQTKGQARIGVTGAIGKGALSAGFLESAAEPPSPATEADDQYPSEMPATPYPNIKGCSSGQEAYLKKAWRLAHYYTWRADRLLDHILSQPEPQRQELWNRDYITDPYSPSSRRWFGPYNRDRAVKVRDAVDKARKRFEMKGSVVKGIGVARCGQPIAAGADKDKDVCPAGNPSADGPPSAYHAPVGTVVTCPSFWNTVNNQFVDYDVKLSDAAKTLVHEVFHWLSVDGKYVTDYHGDGARGEKDDKYYGAQKATYLAEHKQSWAIYNNDNYAWFIRSVGAYEPTFSAVWSPKEPGTGGFFVDLTWEGLIEKWKSLGDAQYLADVETYVKDGVRRYIAVWRVGKGNGALLATDWAGFSKKFGELKNSQDLIDVEVYKHGNSWMYLGVYRAKQGRTTGDGGLLAGLSWEQLVEKWKQFSNAAYLADVETYVEDGQRKYIAVWRVGKGNGALYKTTDWEQFAKLKRDLNKTQELIDFEKFITLDGKWNYLGVWRDGNPSEVLHETLTLSELLAKRNDYKADRTLVDVEEYTALPARIK